MRIDAIVALAAAIPIQPLVSPEVLEPSVLNEVEHAISRAPECAVAAAATNAAAARVEGLVPPGATATDAAVRLVSSQRRDGRWLDGTNDCTVAAVRMLLEISGLNPPVQTHGPGMLKRKEKTNP